MDLTSLFCVWEKENEIIEVVCRKEEMNKLLNFDKDS